MTRPARRAAWEIGALQTCCVRDNDLKAQNRCKLGHLNNGPSPFEHLWHLQMTLGCPRPKPGERVQHLSLKVQAQPTFPRNPPCHCVS